jgi:hypothetical protein
MLLQPLLLLHVQLLFMFWKWLSPPQCFTLVFQILTRDLTVRFTTSGPMVFPKILPDVLSFLRCNCSFKPWFLIPLMPSGFARVSSRTSVLSEFLVQPCPSPVPDDSVPYDVQKWNAGSSLCRLWSTSSRTHHCSGSISSAVCSTLQLDASPHTAPSVLQKFPLQPLL